jgi:hypothetical protein
MVLLDADLSKFLISTDEWNVIDELCQIFEVNLFYYLKTHILIKEYNIILFLFNN